MCYNKVKEYTAYFGIDDGSKLTMGDKGTVLLSPFFLTKVVLYVMFELVMNYAKSGKNKK